MRKSGWHSIESRARCELMMFRARVIGVGYLLSTEMGHCCDAIW